MTKSPLTDATILSRVTHRRPMIPPVRGWERGNGPCDPLRLTLKRRHREKVDVNYLTPTRLGTNFSPSVIHHRCTRTIRRTSGVQPSVESREKTPNVDALEVVTYISSNSKYLSFWTQPGESSSTSLPPSSDETSSLV